MIVWNGTQSTFYSKGDVLNVRTEVQKSKVVYLEPVFGDAHTLSREDEAGGFHVHWLGYTGSSRSGKETEWDLGGRVAGHSSNMSKAIGSIPNITEIKHS